MTSTRSEPGTLAYALETADMALTLWDDAVPWRYLRWRRKLREVKRRQKLHAQAMGWKS